MSNILESEQDMFNEIAQRVFVLTSNFAGHDPLSCKKMQGVALQLKEIMQDRLTNKGKRSA